MKKHQWSDLGHPDGTRFNMDNDGAYLTIWLKKPSEEEIAAISSSGEIRMVCFPDCLWFTFKFGTLTWMDAPFTPQFCTDDLIQHLDTACSKIEVTLIDPSSAEILFSGIVDVPEIFKGGMIAGCGMILMSEFDADGYRAFTRYVKDTYTQNQLANTALIRAPMEFTETWLSDSVQKTRWVMVNILDPLCGQRVEDILEGRHNQCEVYHKEKWEVSAEEYNHYYKSKVDAETGEAYVCIVYQDGEPEYNICTKAVWWQIYRKIESL